MDDDLKVLLVAIREENTETRHQFKVIAEGLRHEIQTVAEGVTTNSEKIDRFDAKINHIAADRETRVTRLEATTSR